MTFLEDFMKRNVLRNMVVAVAIFFTSCASTPMRESLELFQQETGLSVKVPMRFYTWVKVEYAERVMPDIGNALLDFEYDGSGDYLLKTVTQDDKILSVWGNQILLQDQTHRTLVFTPFIMAIYALENEQDPLNIAFEALKQILATGAYNEYEKNLIPVFNDGIKQYRTGGIAWENYKAEHFVIENKTITIK
jgi:hypothetical protein